MQSSVITMKGERKMKPRLRYVVEIKYETMSGEEALRVYNVESTNGQSAIKTAQIRIEKMKHFKKTICSVAEEVKRGGSYE